MVDVNLNGKQFEKTFNNFVDDLFAENPVYVKKERIHEPGRRESVPVNIREDRQGYKLEFIAPGFDKTDFRIGIDKNILTVSGEKKAAGQQENARQIRQEYHHRSFKRSFLLDEKTETAGIEATYENGVLTLNLPRKEPVKQAVQEIKIQ